MKVAIAVLLAAFALTACNRADRTREVETEIKTETDASGQVVKTEAEAVGRLPGGEKVEAENRMYIGTVTELEAGKRIEIKSTDGETQSFDLAERGTLVTVQPSVAKGQTVEVIVEKQKDQPKKISVIARVR